MSRVVVLQADGRRLPGGLRSPLSVGLARWRGSGRETAVVAKVTLRFDAPGEEVDARLDEPRPVAEDVPSELSPDAVIEASDFVVHKPLCDVSVVGHAHAATAQEEIHGHLAIGHWLRSFVARARSRRRSIPLIEGHLFDEAGTPMRWAPVPVEREAEGTPRDRFDDARLQSGAAVIEPPPAGAVIELSGLSARGPERRVRQPGLRPRVFFEPRARPWVEVPLRCDTLWSDTDHERCVLAWRGLVPPELHRADRVVACLDDEADPRPFEVLARDVPRREVVFAVDEGATGRPDPDELEMARYEAVEWSALPEMELEAYARVSAELAEQRRPRGDVLADHGHDERSWTIEERAWGQAVAHDAVEGAGSLADALAAAFAQAQEELAGAEEPRPREDYLRLKERIEGGTPAEVVLSEAGIGLGEGMRLERHWRAADEGA